MSNRFSLIRRTIIASGLALLAGCAGVLPGPPGVAAEAPTYRVGERWVYHAEDGFLQPAVWEEVREVVAVGSEGITLRITQRGASVHSVRMERLSAPGRVQVGAVFDDETRRFAKDLVRYDFPLVPGKTWNQWLRNVDEATGQAGEINRYVRVGGWRRITTPAGTFDAIGLSVVMHLDDETFWRDRTECTYQLWYAPAVKAVVREDKEAQYLEKSDRLDGWPIRSQHARLELVAYAPPAP